MDWGVCKLYKITNVFWNVVKITIIIFMFMLSIALLLQVISRFIIKAPIIWTEEVVRMTFIWIVMLGSVIATKYDMHLKADIVSNRLSAIHKMLHSCFIYIIMLIVCLIFVVSGFDFLVRNMLRVSETTGVPMYYLYIAAPLSGAAMCCLIVRKIFYSIKIAKADRRDRS